MRYALKAKMQSPSLTRLARGALGRVKARREHKMPAPAPVRRCACSEALKLGLAAHLLRCTIGRPVTSESINSERKTEEQVEMIEALLKRSLCMHRRLLSPEE